MWGGDKGSVSGPCWMDVNSDAESGFMPSQPAQ